MYFTLQFFSSLSDFRVLNKCGVYEKKLAWVKRIWNEGFHWVVWNSSYGQLFKMAQQRNLIQLLSHFKCIQLTSSLESDCSSCTVFFSLPWAKTDKNFLSALLHTTWTSPVWANYSDIFQKNHMGPPPTALEPGLQSEGSRYSLLNPIQTAG